MVWTHDFKRQWKRQSKKHLAVVVREKKVGVRVHPAKQKRSPQLHDERKQKKKKRMIVKEKEGDANQSEFQLRQRNALQNRHTSGDTFYAHIKASSAQVEHPVMDVLMLFLQTFFRASMQAHRLKQEKERTHSELTRLIMKNLLYSNPGGRFFSSLISLLYAAFFTLWCKQIPHILSHRSIPPATPTLRFYSPLCPPPLTTASSKASHHDPASNVSPALPPLVDMELSMATAGWKFWPSAFALPFSLACYPCPEYSQEQRHAHPHLAHSSIHMQIQCGQWKYDGMCVQTSTTTLHDSHLSGKETSLRACVVILCEGKKIVGHNITAPPTPTPPPLQRPNHAILCHTTSLTHTPSSIKDLPMNDNDFYFGFQIEQAHLSCGMLAK